MKRALSMLLAAAACAAACAQTATKMQATKANEYGLAYSLPTTVLDIAIETEYTEQTPGEFYNYAQRNLNIGNAITKHSLAAAVKSVTISTRGVADGDPEKMWRMQVKPGQNSFVMLDENGSVLAINTDDLPAAPSADLPSPMPKCPTALETPEAKQAMTQDMIMATSMPKKAALATERIFELRQNRNDLISGQADNTPPDGQSMQLALDNLAAQEAALTAMFAGTTSKWTDVKTVTFTPGDEEIDGEVVARISPVEGVVDPSDLAGEPLVLSMRIVAKGELPLDDKGQPLPFPKNGVAYAIPGTAIVAVSCRGKQLASVQVSLAQLGCVYGLDPKLFTDKKAPACVIFNPATGAIVSQSVREM